MFFPLFTIGTVIILLQLYHMAVLNWLWPFCAGIAVHLVGGILQFVRLVLLPRGKRPSA